METREIGSKIVVQADGSRQEIFAMDPDEDRLFELFRMVFENYWQQVHFGPLIQGAAWEVAAPNAPTKVSLMDGYLTVNFGAWHFHICIGENKGTKAHPIPDKLRAHRRTSRAEFYRQLSQDGLPTSWGFRCFNGEGEQQITVFFPNPNYDLEPKFKKNNPPKWENLEIWDALRKEFLGMDPDELDRKTEFKPCGAM